MPGEWCRDFTQRAVELGAAPVHAVDFVFAHAVYDLLLAGFLGVDVGNQDRFAVVLGKGLEIADAVDDRTVADVMEAGLVADAVDGHVVNVVFEGADAGHQGGVFDRLVGPIGRLQNQVGPH